MQIAAAAKPDRIESARQIPAVPARSSVPPTAGELAAASVRWERRGFLGRLVRLPDPIRVVEERRF